MGILLFLLTFNVPTDKVEERPYCHVNKITPIETFAVGMPEQKAEWKEAPNIRVCSDTLVTLSRTYRAIDYWERLGYDFGIVKKDNLSTCMNPRRGEIVITLPESGFSDNHMGATRLYTDVKSGDIVKAKIFILPKHARKERVLEHEIGHALGWSHYRQRYHMMHPSWMYGGFDSYGLRHK